MVLRKIQSQIWPVCAKCWELGSKKILLSIKRNENKQAPLSILLVSLLGSPKLTTTEDTAKMIGYL